MLFKCWLPVSHLPSEWNWVTHPLRRSKCPAVASIYDPRSVFLPSRLLASRSEMSCSYMFGGVPRDGTASTSGWRLLLLNSIAISEFSGWKACHWHNPDCPNKGHVPPQIFCSHFVCMGGAGNGRVGAQTCVCETDPFMCTARTVDLNHQRNIFNVRSKTKSITSEVHINGLMPLSKDKDFSFRTTIKVHLLLLTRFQNVPTPSPKSPGTQPGPSLLSL